MRILPKAFDEGIMIRMVAPMEIFAAKGNALINRAAARDLYDWGNMMQEKLFEDMPEDERIRLFVESHEDGKAYPNQDFFEWHNKLTGSCLMGREQFAREHEVDLEASMTVREFIKLTENAYGGSTIRKLKEFHS